MVDVGTRSEEEFGSADELDGRPALNAGEREGGICCVGDEGLERPSSPRENDNGPSGLAGNGLKEIGLESIEVEGCETASRNEGQSSLNLYLASHELQELPEKVVQDEQYEFTGLSPLRTEGGGSSTGIDIVGLLDGRRECNGCENGFIVSPALVAECTLEDNKGDADNVEEENFCMPVPTDSEKNQIDGEHGTLLLVKPEKEENQFFLVTASKDSPCCAELQESSVVNNQPSQEIESSLQVHSDEEGCQVSHGPGVESCSAHGSESNAVYSYPEDGCGQVSLAVTHHPAEITQMPVAPGSCAAVIDDANLTSGKTVNQAIGNPKSSTTIVFRRTNPKRVASTRTKQTNGKHDKLSRAKGNARKHKEADESISSVSTHVLKIPLQHMTRKRSSSHKLARHSIWGAAENLAELFKNNAKDALCDSPIQIQNKNPKKGKSSSGRRKQNRGLSCRRSQVAKNKNPSLSHPADTEDKNSPETMFPVVVQSQAPFNMFSDTSLTSADCYIEVGLLKEASELKYKFSDNRCNDKLTSMKPKSHQGDKDLESTVTQDTSVENVQCDYLGISSQMGEKAMVDTIDFRQLINPETSPDSDVCHPIPDANGEGITSVTGDAATDGILPVLRPTSQVDMNDAVITSSGALPTHEPTQLLDKQPYTKKGKKGNSRKKDAKVNGSLPPLSECLTAKEKFHGPNETVKVRKPSRRSRHGAEKQCGLGRRNSLSSKLDSKTTTGGSKCKSFSVELPMPETAKLEYCEGAARNETGLDNCTLSVKNLGNSNSEAMHSGTSLVTAKGKSRKLRKGTKMEFRVGAACHPDAVKHNKCANAKKKESLQKSIFKNVYTRGKRKPESCLKASRGVDTSSGIGDILALAGSNKLSSGEILSSVPCHGVDDWQSLLSRVAWVLCDDCHKWRCISAELADAINETKCRWICKDNADKAFADCSIPQEKTDAQINAELGISDEEECLNVQPIFKGVEPSKLAASPSAAFKLIKSNLFLHRNRRTQNIDEVMVCHCKPPSNGGLGCGEQCLNRMLNIECVRGTCPCGEFCSNRQFQKRKYAQFEWFPCGKKGYGLKVLEDVCKGQFLIEYVGEVLDLATYEQRQKDYASRGQKHFYFMTLNGGEVIDACAKGNLGRFINHSCDPNCRTEKWMVNGEVCIGLFAIRDIREGEEVTFDYNYVRVFGAAAKKCVCGSSECRGYIGGDPSNTEAIVHGDSDEEYPLPVMVDEDVDESISDAIGTNAVCVETVDETIKCSPANPESEIQQKAEPILRIPVVKPLPTLDATQIENVVDRPLSDVHPSKNSTQNLSSTQTEGIMCRPTFDVRRPLDLPPQTLPALERITSNKIKDKKEDKANVCGPQSHAKPSRSSVGLKKGRQSVKGLIPYKPREVLTTTRNVCFEGVEEKLNELLEVDGGISKRKDSTKGYLKLLFVTAAEGDNVRGRASQSIRDLSLILDALLKTKSRSVLMDIINKNGLQMLHNIMKQNRSNFNRIPIIRKLLKVLEFLASKGILTPEHMNKGPPREGMESFRDSMLSLTKHNDIQVHQIARNFRDKWIPRSIKSVESSDRDHNMPNCGDAFCSWTPSIFRRRHDMETRDSDAIVCVNGEDFRLSSNEMNTPGEISEFGTGHPVTGCFPFTDASTDGSPTIRAQSRKRKSRWDQPTDTTMSEKIPVSNEDLTLGGSKSMKHTIFTESTSQHDAMEQMSETKGYENNSPSKSNIETSVQPNVDDEAPPGFGSCKDIYSQVSPKASEATGEVAMGHLLERYQSHLTVSYGLPLEVLQQLGTYEVGRSQYPPRWAVAPGMPFHPFPPLPTYPRGNREAQLFKESSTVSRANITSDTSGEKPACQVEPGLRHCQNSDRGRWPSRVPRRKFFNSQRWNNKKFQRCWPPQPWDGGHFQVKGSSSDGVSSPVAGNISDGGVGLGIPESERSNGVNSNFYQQ